MAGVVPLPSWFLISKFFLQKLWWVKTSLRHLSALYMGQMGGDLEKGIKEQLYIVVSYSSWWSAFKRLILEIEHPFSATNKGPLMDKLEELLIKIKTMYY